MSFVLGWSPDINLSHVKSPFDDMFLVTDFDKYIVIFVKTKI